MSGWPPNLFLQRERQPSPDVRPLTPAAVHPSGGQQGDELRDAAGAVTRQPMEARGTGDGAFSGLGRLRGATRPEIAPRTASTAGRKAEWLRHSRQGPCVDVMQHASVIANAKPARSAAGRGEVLRSTEGPADPIHPERR
jgi:hypothetical protein